MLSRYPGATTTHSNPYPSFEINSHGCIRLSNIGSPNCSQPPWIQMSTGHPPGGGSDDGVQTLAYRQSSEYYHQQLSVWRNTSACSPESCGNGDGGCRHKSLNCVASYGLSDFAKKSDGSFLGCCHRKSPTGGRANGRPINRLTYWSTFLPTIEAPSPNGIVTSSIVLISLLRFFP